MTQTQLDNTVLVFTSDNGYYNGEHRLHQKIGPYEEGIRVPLAIRYPKLSTTFGWSTGPITLHDFVLNTDLAPTIADLAGVSTPLPVNLHGVDGQSLYPHLTFGATAAPWPRKRFLIEHWAPVCPGFGCQVGDTPDVSEGNDFYPTFIGVRTDPSDPSTEKNTLYMKYDVGNTGSWNEYEYYGGLNNYGTVLWDGQDTDNCKPDGLVICPLLSNDPLDEFLTAFSNSPTVCNENAAPTCQALENAASYPPGPYIGVFPGSGKAGTTITVVGSGYGSGEAITLFFNGSQVGTTNADGSGKFSAPIIAPSCLSPVLGTVAATGASSGTATGYFAEMSC
jgi:hypothetical protein